MLKNVVFSLTVAALLSSCVSVRFPSEITVRLSFPEHMSSSEVDHIIGRIPSRIQHRDGSMKVHVFKDKDSIKYGTKEFLFLSDEGKHHIRKDSVKQLIIIKDDQQ